MAIPKGWIAPKEYRMFMEQRERNFHIWELPIDAQICMPFDKELIDYPNMKDVVVYKPEDLTVPLETPPPQEENGQLIIPWTTNSPEEELMLGIKTALEPFIGGKMSNWKTAAISHAIEKVLLRYEKIMSTNKE